jgi:hypothetical protein
MNEQPASTHAVNDFFYDALYVCGIGGGVIALFFCAYDSIVHGDPLFTPGLLGSALFDRANPATIHAVGMGAITKYTAFHMLAFSVLGLGISFLAQAAKIYRRPWVVLGLVFAILEVGFWLAAQAAVPGVIQRIGIVPVTIANLLAATGIAMFLSSAHRPGLVHRMRRALHLGGDKAAESPIPASERR